MISVYRGKIFRSWTCLQNFKFWIFSLWSRLHSFGFLIEEMCTEYVLRPPDRIRYPTSAETCMWGSNRLPCWLPRGQQVSHQRSISENTYHVHLCLVRIRLPTLASETQRRCHQKSKWEVTVAPQKELMSSNNLKKNCFEHCGKG